MTTRNTCFTLNNYTEEEYESVINWECQYLIVGKEVGENGTPHLQGYVEWNNSKRFSVLKNLNPRIHWENRKGTANQASDYCKKSDEKAFIKGTISKQGKRSDLTECCDAIKARVPIREIAINYPETFVRYYRGFDRLDYEVSDHRTEAPYVEWRYGKAGVGKTHGAIEKHKDSYYMKDNSKWWDGYRYEEAIIIGDFSPSVWDFKGFLELLDKWKYQGEIKGGYVKINSPYIYVCCEFSPMQLWRDNDLDQLTRRCAKIIDCGDVAYVAEVTGNTRQSLLNDS